MANHAPLSAAGAGGSTFKGLGRKLKLMFIYIWPKKSLPLQITALFCFSMLLVGRVVNPLVPLYNKWIVGEFGFLLIIIFGVVLKP